MAHYRSFTLALLLSCTLTTMTEMGDHENSRRQFILLTHPLLHTIDGVPKLMDEKGVYDAMQVRTFINKLFTNKTYHRGDTLVSLNDIVIDFMDLTDTKIPSSDPRWTTLTDALKAMKKDFQIFNEPLLQQAAQAKDTNIRLIKEWCDKSGRHDSLLLNWGKIDEYELLAAATPLEFRQFCVDLKNFLHDLMFSCPKARKLFKERCIKDKSRWAAFDKGFEQTH